MPLSLPVSFPLRIAGRLRPEAPKAEIHSPYDGHLVGTHGVASLEEAREAATHARALFETTRGMPACERKGWLRRLAALVQRDREALAELMARESAKPLLLASIEVDRAVSTLELGAEEATRLGGEVIPMDLTPATEGYVGAVVRVPRGPVLAFAPFNFPLNLVCHKVAPALAIGAPVVLKPPPQAPLCSLYLESLLSAVGAPIGMLQVVPCGILTAEGMVKDDAFAVFSFTGSDRVGFDLKRIAYKKKVILELGGNAAAIVHNDADLDWAAERITEGAFAYAGQVCIKVQRLYVDSSIYEQFVINVVRRAGALTLKDPLDPASLMGPLIDESAARRVESWVAEATDRGAHVLLGGKRIQNQIPPTILAIDGYGEGLKVVEEELFGPVLTVHRTQGFEQALQWANRSRFGLQAGVFTRDIGRIQKAFQTLDVGGVIINDAPTLRVDAMPYGGVKGSGSGREGVRYAIEEMTDRKLLVIRNR